LRVLLFTASGKTPAEHFYRGKKGKKKGGNPVLPGFLVFRPLVKKYPVNNNLVFVEGYLAPPKTIKNVKNPCSIHYIPFLRAYQQLSKNHQKSLEYS
jgi:hypothetical protein